MLTNIAGRSSSTRSTLKTRLVEFQKAEVNLDWCDPSAANPRDNRRLSSSSTASVARPQSPMVQSVQMAKVID